MKVQSMLFDTPSHSAAAHGLSAIRRPPCIQASSSTTAQPKERARPSLTGTTAAAASAPASSAAAWRARGRASRGVLAELGVSIGTVGSGAARALPLLTRVATAAAAAAAACGAVGVRRRRWWLQTNILVRRSNRQRQAPARAWTHGSPSPAGRGARGARAVGSRGLLHGEVDEPDQAGLAVRVVLRQRDPCPAKRRAASGLERSGPAWKGGTHSQMKHSSVSSGMAPIAPPPPAEAPASVPSPDSAA